MCAGNLWFQKVFYGKRVIGAVPLECNGGYISTDADAFTNIPPGPINSWVQPPKTGNVKKDCTAIFVGGIVSMFQKHYLLTKGSSISVKDTGPCIFIDARHIAWSQNDRVYWIVATTISLKHSRFGLELDLKVGHLATLGECNPYEELSKNPMYNFDMDGAHEKLESMKVKN